MSTVFLCTVIGPVHTPLCLKWLLNYCLNDLRKMLWLNIWTLKLVNDFPIRCSLVSLTWVESKWIWPQPHTQATLNHLPSDLIFTTLFPKNPIKAAAHCLLSGCKWWVWSRVQPNHHLSAVCLHAQALAVCWTETANQRVNLTENSRTPAESFPLLSPVCRILNNNFCEKYSCYSKSGRKSHLCPEKSSNPPTEVRFPSTFLTCSKQRGEVWRWHSLWYLLLLCSAVYLLCVLHIVWCWISSRETQSWHRSQRLSSSPKNPPKKYSEAFRTTWNALSCSHGNVAFWLLCGDLRMLPSFQRPLLKLSLKCVCALTLWGHSVIKFIVLAVVCIFRNHPGVIMWNNILISTQSCLMICSSLAL